MRSTAVSFRGCKQVIEAYRANDMSSWAVANGKDVMFAEVCDSVEDGEAMLTEILKKLQTGGSRAQFTLRVYELSGKDKIMNNTPWSRSFNFALYNDEDEYSPFEHGRRTYAVEADERIKKLQDEIDAMKLVIAEGDGEPEKETGINGFISGIVQDPFMKQTLMQALAGIIQKVVPMNAARPAAVAGIEGQSQALQSVLLPGQPEKVQEGINVLCTQDPVLGDHLIKLGNIALTNPQNFKMLLGMLQNF
jgi:hypothetical protein